MCEDGDDLTDDPFLDVRSTGASESIVKLKRKALGDTFR